MKNSIRSLTATVAALALAVGGSLALTSPVIAAPAPLTNTAHLDFLLDTATPPDQAGHTTYRLADEPSITMPWTYADARDGGTFQRVGGGALDPATGDYGQGAYNSDDVSRAAVVYLRHWRLTGSDASRDKAFELLRSLAYFQTVDGPNAGNVVLWMQSDGELNASAEPIELPDPSDSAESYWLARSLWAFGEGYAAFASGPNADPEFAAFLQDRIHLGLAALNRGSLADYGTWTVSDGVKVPAWLIADGADISGEAVLGLAAYVAAVPDDTAARTALTQLSEGVAAMSSGSLRSWPYGAVLPWTHSLSNYHSWSSQMPAALAAASTVLARPDLLKPAVADAATFTPTLLTSNGPDNGWFPTPGEKTQIAYGADSRLQSLLAVGAASGSAGITALAGIEASWYFGTNASGAPVYVPATGVTYDGVAADGTVNRNSGAESTIHGLLSMIALDAHPDVAKLATSLTKVDSRDGLRIAEAEAATSTTGVVSTPAAAWTGESLYSGDVLTLTRGQKATIPLGTGPAGSVSQPHWVEPVQWLDESAKSTSIWTAGYLPLGVVSASAGAQGVSEAPGVLRALKLTLPVPASQSAVTVRALSGTSTIDALIVRPVVSSLAYSGSAHAQLFTSSALLPQKVSMGWAGVSSRVAIYGADGSSHGTRAISGVQRIQLKPGEFATVLG